MGSEASKTNKRGQFKVCQRNAIAMAFSMEGRYRHTLKCWLGSFVIFRGFGPVLLGNTSLSICAFFGGGGGGGGGSDPPSGSAHERNTK